MATAAPEGAACHSFLWSGFTLHYSTNKREDVVGRTTASFRVIKRSEPGPPAGREEGPPGTFSKCPIRTRLPVWICFRAPLQCRSTRFFPPTRVDEDQMSEPFKSLSRPPREPEIHLCSALLPEPLSDLFTLRVKPRILRAAERICSFAVRAQDKEGKLWGEPS